MKPGDQVYRWMTVCPQTISRDTSVATAAELMQTLDIRHLPVLDDGEIVGIITDRDIATVDRFVDSTRVRVGYIMSEPPFVAAPSAPLAEVAGIMANHKYGSAIIVDNGNVVGIFTVTDALRALAEDCGTPSARGLERDLDELDETG